MTTDTERLNWMNRQHKYRFSTYQSLFGYWCVLDSKIGTRSKFKTVRQAVDAAMKLNKSLSKKGSQ